MTPESTSLDLETLFADATHELDGEAFTGDVMAKTRRLVYRVAAVIAGLVLALLFCAWWFAVPVRELSLLITQFLGTPLIDLGEGWLGWLATPVNNIAALSALSIKLLRVMWKKMVGASYA
jgi:hypothetical protein